MAVLIGVYDPDYRRRATARYRLAEPFSSLGGLSRREFACGHLDIYCDAATSAPISWALAADGPRTGCAFVVGDWIENDRFETEPAQRVLADTLDAEADVAGIAGKNGYYLAVAIDPAGSLHLGTDTLGYFPLYYWYSGEVFLFGTSPELFKAHPSFQVKPNRYAITSILLLSHISGGQAIYEGVRRPEPGHRIEWTPNQPPRELLANPLEMSDEGFGISYCETRDRISEVFDSYFKALAGRGPCDIFLSGGQDSRLVAAYATTQMVDEDVEAVSLGRSSDTELTYARQVSRVAGWRHRYRDINSDDFAQFAAEQIRLESLQGPFVNFSSGTAQQLLSERGVAHLSGYFGDRVLGDKGHQEALCIKTGLFNFDAMLERLNRLGFEERSVNELLSESSPGTCKELIADLKMSFDSLTGFPFQQSWLFGMTHRQRFHIGSIVWRLSLASWPRLPYLDRRLLETSAGMPLHYFEDRRIQADILKMQFPRLARIPLDRNSRTPGYLLKPNSVRLRQAFPTASDISWRLHSWLEKKQSRRESRYYFRTYDFNGTGWRAVRTEVDRHRNKCVSLLNPAQLDLRLPNAESSPQFSDGIVDSYKVKSLAGLVLWAAKNT